MTPNRIHLITLATDDLPRARAFYEALGWEPEEALENVVFYDLGGLKLGLFPRDMLAEELKRPVADLGKGAMSLSQTFPDEAAVEAAYKAALAAGASAVAAPFKTAWGGFSSYIADPDGHVWEFAFNPFWPIGEDGRLA